MTQTRKFAGLFKIPDDVLKINQRKVLEVFCSVALTKCIQKEFEIKTKDEQTDDDATDLYHISLVKEICRTYNAQPHQSYLTPKTFRYLAKLDINKDGVISNLSITITTDQSFANDISKATKMEGEWEGLFVPTQGIFISISLDRLDKDILDESLFLNALNAIRNTIRHELQHAYQIYSDKASYGLPSKKIQDKSRTPFGTTLNENSSAQKENGEQQQQDLSGHSFRDIEFYTDLTDAVQDFKLDLNLINTAIVSADEYLNTYIDYFSSSNSLLNPLHKIHLKLQNLFLKTFIGEIGQGEAKYQAQVLINQAVRPLHAEKELIQEIRNNKVLDLPNNHNRFQHIINKFANNQFLLDLRLQAPDKYKKAIVEFYKAVRTLL